MNKVAKALIVIGILNIIGGIVIGFSTYKVEVPGLVTYIERENYSILFMWIGAGIISGIMMFGFAEIIRLLQEKRDFTEEQLETIKDFRYQFKVMNEKLSEEAIKEKEVYPVNSEPEKTKTQLAEDFRKSVDEKDIEELKKDLQSKGYQHDFIEAMIAQKKRQMNS